MEINIAKTMAQHVMHNPPVSNILEEDIPLWIWTVLSKQLKIELNGVKTIEVE